MFLRSTRRQKNGKCHRYFSVVENRRLADGRTHQRQVLYLGEINDSQELAWRKSLCVFDEDRDCDTTLSLFPDDRELPVDAIDAVGLRVAELRLLRPRAFGDCWLGCELWNELHLGEFFSPLIDDQRADVAWHQVLQLLVVNRLVDPGPEFRVHRLWFDRSAMDELLGVDARIADKDRLYRCLDRILPHKDALCLHLRERFKTLFDSSYDVLLYDLTSTYFEGMCERIPMAKHGYSRDGRPDCRQVVIALIITPDGLPVAYEVMPGNTADCATLKDFMAKIESLYGRANRTWVMDRGIPTEATLKTMRQNDTSYLVGTPRSMLDKPQAKLVEQSWSEVHDGMKVKLLRESDEVFVLARSEDRAAKERAMRRRKFKALVRGLRKLKKRMRTPRADGSPSIDRDGLIAKVAVLKKEAGRVSRSITITIPKASEPFTPGSFGYELNAKQFEQQRLREGAYLLRTNLAGTDPAELWRMYMGLVQIESAFKTIKSDLCVRPIHHQRQDRVEAHLMVAFIAYALCATLRRKLDSHAPGLTPRAVLDVMSGAQMLDVVIPTTDGRELLLPRHTEPTPEQQMILERLSKRLPVQPPPRIRSGSPPTTQRA